MNFLSSSRRKISKSFLITILIVAVIFLATDVSLSFVLKRHLNKIIFNSKNNLGLDLGIKFIYFDIFYGISINGFEISKDENKIFTAKNIRFTLDIINTILKKQFICKEVSLDDSHIYEIGPFEKFYLSILLTNLRESKDMFKSTLVKVNDLNFNNSYILDLDGYIALAQGKVFLTRGKAGLIRAKALEKTKPDLRSSVFDWPLNYALEATFTDKDLVINKLDLASRSARLILSGRIIDFSDLVNLEIEGELKDFLLEDISLLNNEFCRTRGLLNADFSITGPLETPNFNVGINISNSSLNIFNSLSISKISSNLVWDNQGLRSQKAEGLIDNSPVNLNIKIDKEGALNKINLELSAKNLEFFDEFNVNFQGGIRDGGLEGGMEVILGYVKEQNASTATFSLKNIYFNLKDLNFKCDFLNIALGEFDEADDSVKNIRKLEFTNIKGNLALAKNNLSIYNLRSNMYSGTLKGNAVIESRENAFFYNFKLYLNNLKIEEMAKQFLNIDYQLSGLLSGKVALNNQVSESVTGSVDILGGKIENNAVQIAISDFFGIPSLKTIDFSKLNILFSKVWDKYEAQINLFSPNVGIYIDSKFFADDTVEGYLLAKLATQLMDESVKFKRLFKYIGYKEPVVYFPFKLRGYLDKPRIEWLKNEFKERLQNFLPESYEKLIQDELNKFVEEAVE